MTVNRNIVICVGDSLTINDSTHKVFRLDNTRLKMQIRSVAAWYRYKLFFGLEFDLTTNPNE